MRYRHIIIFIIGLTLVACNAATDTNNTALTLPMGYVANVQFSPFYVGVERGYFSEAGFDVTFDYRWETDGVQLVAAGELPFTVASGDQVIQARSQGLPVVAVAAWYQKFPVAILSLNDTPLNSPQDLRGLSIGIPETLGASYIGLRALLAAGDLTESDIDLQSIGYTQLAALTSGSVDAVVVYANNEPLILAQEDLTYNILYVTDYANLISAVLITNDTQIEKSPEEVQAFVDAFIHGLQDTLDDPQAAFTISENYVEGLTENASSQRAVFDATLKYWDAPALGVFQPDAWEKAQTVMLEAGLIESRIATADLFSNAFVSQE